MPETKRIWAKCFGWTISQKAQRVRIHLPAMRHFQYVTHPPTGVKWMYGPDESGVHSQSLNAQKELAYPKPVRQIFSLCAPSERKMQSRGNANRALHSIPSNKQQWPLKSKLPASNPWKEACVGSRQRVLPRNIRISGCLWKIERKYKHWMHGNSPNWVEIELGKTLKSHYKNNVY